MNKPLSNRHFHHIMTVQDEASTTGIALLNHTIKAFFGLPLRTLEGFINTIFQLMDALLISLVLAASANASRW